MNPGRDGLGSPSFPRIGEQPLLHDGSAGTPRTGSRCSTSRSRCRRLHARTQAPRRRLRSLKTRCRRSSSAQDLGKGSWTAARRGNPRAPGGEAVPRAARRWFGAKSKGNPPGPVPGLGTRISGRAAAPAFMALLSVEYSDLTSDNVRPPARHAERRPRQSAARVRAGHRPPVLAKITRRAPKASSSTGCRTMRCATGCWGRSTAARGSSPPRARQRAGAFLVGAPAEETCGAQVDPRQKAIRATAPCFHETTGAMLKIFRRIEPGPNPDFEIGQYLFQHGFTRTPAAPPVALEYHRPSFDPGTIGIVQAAGEASGIGLGLFDRRSAGATTSASPRALARLPARKTGRKGRKWQEGRGGAARRRFFAALEQWYLTSGPWSSASGPPEMHLALADSTHPSFRAGTARYRAAARRDRGLNGRAGQPRAGRACSSASGRSAIKLRPSSGGAAPPRGARFIENFRRRRAWRMPSRALRMRVHGGTTTSEQVLRTKLLDVVNKLVLCRIKYITALPVVDDSNGFRKLTGILSYVDHT